MGKTLRKTACSPTSERSFCGTFDCRNLSYDVFWMSMRFGTSMTFRTRPRCLRMRKVDWRTLAIAAPAVSFGGREGGQPRDGETGLVCSARANARHGGQAAAGTLV